MKYFCVLGLADGKLVRWTKGFSCEGVEGENVVELLQAALQRRGDVRIDVCAILNDTTGRHVLSTHKLPSMGSFETIMQHINQHS